MEERTRYQCGGPRRRGETSKTERQANFLTFQIFMVAFLLGAVWLVKWMRLDVYGDIQRLTGLLLSTEEYPLSALVRYEQVEALLSGNFDFGGLFPAPAPDPGGDGAPGQAPQGAGGVYGGALLDAAGALQAPRSALLSPLLLTAQPRPPVSGTVTSGFGWRENPLAPGTLDFHTGLDIASPEGTPILAALPGVVKDTGYSESYGNYIHVAHVNGLETHYCHCSAIIARPGEVVRQGERIALVGSTGNVTGAHLHFEIRQDAKTADPLEQLLPA